MHMLLSLHNHRINGLQTGKSMMLASARTAILRGMRTCCFRQCASGQAAAMHASYVSPFSLCSS
jgi:hypothetical protein